MSITSPAAGATVSGPKAKIEVGAKNFTLVDANVAPRRGARKPTINEQNAGINRMEASMDRSGTPYTAAVASRDFRDAATGLAQISACPGPGAGAGPYCPGARYDGCIFTASSTSAGLISTVVLMVTAPLALIVRAVAAMLALFGMSTMTKASVSPKA
jgi:hypothetical protein